MNTVKHYKDLGLVFVESDCVDNNPSNDGSDIIPLSKRMELLCNNVDYDYDNAPVGEFAWRNNTCEETAYKGYIELTYNEVQAVTTMLASEIDWDEDISFWRPALIDKQSALITEQEKTIFTQEMSDANELVPLGAGYKVGLTTYTCVAHHLDGGIIGKAVNGRLTHHEQEHHDISPLKTQKDIEIDLIGELINKYNSGEGSFEDLHEHFRVTKVEK